MVPKEQIHNWLNTGFSDRAVAGVGMSAENVNKLLLTGEVPFHCPKPDMISYQRKLVSGANGGFLYYSHPFIEQFSKFNPKLAKEIIGSLSGAEECLADEDIISSLKHYALRWAIRDYYFENFGVYRYGWDIAMTAAYLFPRMMQTRLQQNPELNNLLVDNAWSENDESGLESSNMPLNELNDILGECLSRRGVLVFYNEGIFDHRVLTNHEDETDVMILSKTPLTSDVVSGIKPLSEKDKQVMLRGVRF